MSTKPAPPGFDADPSQGGHTLYIARITAVEVSSAITRRQRGATFRPPRPGRSSDIFAGTGSALQRPGADHGPFGGAMLVARKTA